MILSDALIPIMIIAALWHAAATIIICHALRRRGVEVSFLLLRLYAPKYASQYRAITVKETGRTGLLFYHWLIPILAALAALVLIIIVKLV